MHPPFAEHPRRYPQPVTAMPRLKALIMMLAAASAVLAQTPGSTVAETDIVSHITASGRNTVSQPEALSALLRPAAPRPEAQPEASPDAEEKSAPQATGIRTRTAGYRVQVFSDNNPASAKSEARSKARNISGQFPQHRTYITFTSPYWRLRVGDFRSQAEAEAAADDIRRAFPSYAKELRVVRDRINLTD